jgi:glycosyltransferase involved in cell wall biosynthesis
VTNGVTGIVTEASPGAVAEGIDRVFALPVARLSEMGEEGRRRVAGITWDHVIDTLTASLR